MRQLPSVALLLTLCSTSLIVPIVRVSYAQTSPANSVNQANQKLLGSWETKQDDISLTFIFAPDGKLFIVAPPIPNQQRTAMELQYKVNIAPKPMHLDVFVPRRNQPVQTIFEYTADGKMRMQLEGTDPGVARPTQFKNGTIFEKISDSTVLPEGTELISGSSSSNVPKVQTYVASVNRAQQAYFLEKSKFSANLKDLELGIPSEDAEYRYQIQQPKGQPQRTFVTATPKKANSPSYIGAVFVTKVNGEEITVSGICQTTKPTLKPSAMPILSRTTNEITCPADSTPIQP